MAKPPFRVPAQPTPAPAPQRVTAADKGKVFQHVNKEGEPLDNAAREMGAPDHEVGSTTPKEAGQNRGEDHVQTPEWAPALPWPPAPGVDHKPFKMK